MLNSFYYSFGTICIDHLLLKMAETIPSSSTISSQSIDSTMIDLQTREKILEICNQLGSGCNFDLDDIVITKFELGFVSEIYRIDFLKPIILFVGDQLKPTQTIVLKILSTSSYYDTIKSRVNSIFIGQENLGPKIILMKDEFIVLEFLEGRALLPSDDRNDQLVRLLAQKLARLHSMQIPISKNSFRERIILSLKGWMGKDTWLEVYHGQFRQNLEVSNCEKILSHNLERELDWLCEKILSSMRFDENLHKKIVFTHRDLNHDNIFVFENKQTQSFYDIKFIDFDYSGYNYRGMDLGRYFSDCEQQKKFSDQKIIEDKKMLQFIHYYIDENCQIYGESYRNDPINSPEQLLAESKLFVLYAMIIDIIFCIWTAMDKQEIRRERCIEAEQRFRSYLDFKNRIKDLL
ncbi:Choline kinase alpha [Sarcoptes scabiei]|uniref:Choline kinase alpha n=1 Tax=Sarcoptes scabiei TaxID=52283 RepID=A0A834RBN9_SARSC|nr:Choline kinase alpha [Sarcoptes scabiei]